MKTKWCEREIDRNQWKWR